jgi:beta-glucosidase
MNLLIKFAALLSFFAIASCSSNESAGYKDDKLTVDQRVDDLLSRMTLDEKVAQTFCLSSEWFITENEIDTVKLAKALEHGIGQLRDYFVTDDANSVRITNWVQQYLAKNTRLGIPAIFHGEGLHGYVNNYATSFPQAIALAGSWNLDLIEQVYGITAAEARSRGVQQLLSPVLDIARDPRWGRFSETFGEDPYLNGEIGVRIVKSFQGENQQLNNSKHVMATLKHFPGSGTTVGGLNVAPMVTTERDLREVFLYPFKQAVMRGGAMGVMAFYGEYDGIPVHTNTWLLRDILRKEWGFKGIVVSDYFALKLLTQGWQWEFNRHQVAKDSAEAAQLAINAGVNIEMIVVECYSALKDLVKSGKVPQSVLDGAVKEILACKFKLGLFENPYADKQHAESVSNNPVSRAVALEAAKQSIIMLKNENNLLPIKPGSIKKIAVIGPNAKDTILGDYSTKHPKYFVSVYDGIKQRAGDRFEVGYEIGCRILPPTTEYADELKKDKQRIEQAVALAKASDIIVLAVGGNIETDREGRDRSQLEMLGLQKELITRIYETGKPVVYACSVESSMQCLTFTKKCNPRFYAGILGRKQGRDSRLCFLVIIILQEN